MGGVWIMKTKINFNYKIEKDLNNENSDFVWLGNKIIGSITFVLGMPDKYKFHAEIYAPTTPTGEFFSMNWQRCESSEKAFNFIFNFYKKWIAESVEII
jgi:hypothetical protein